MVTKRRIGDWLTSDELLVGLSAYIAAFVLIHFSGMLSPEVTGILRVLHKPVVLAAVCALIIPLVLRIVSAAKTLRTQRERYAFAAYLGFHAGLLLIVLGVLLSSLTRFEASVVLAEGQSFGSDGTGYREGSLYAARFAVPPDPVLTLVHVSPTFKEGKRASFWNVKAVMTYRSRPGTPDQPLQCSRLLPFFTDGIFLRVDDFGYAPRYRLTDAAGEILDEAYVILRLFPPGSEDSFALKTSPDVFYVKYYPDSSLLGAGRATMAGDRPRPLFKVRVTRNLDLLVPTRSLEMNEKALIKPEILSFADVKKWVEIDVVKDPGLYLILPGLLLVVGAAGFALYRRRDRIWESLQRF